MPDDSQSSQLSPDADPDSANVEHRFHTYVGTRIPWYVRLIWLFFWIVAIVYTVQYLFPDFQREILNPP